MITRVINHLLIDHDFVGPILTFDLWLVKNNFPISSDKITMK